MQNIEQPTKCGDYETAFKARYQTWLKNFSNAEITEQISLAEQMLDSCPTEFLLMEEAIWLLEIMKEECVQRIAAIAAFDRKEAV